MTSDLRPIALIERPNMIDSTENLTRFFYERIRDHLHIVLCMSPANPLFSERARKFPGLISGCTIDWFLKWPEQALIEVAQGTFGEFSIELQSQGPKLQLMAHMASVHTLVGNSCQEYYEQMRRRIHQTPKSYLSFLNTYRDMYSTKLNQIKQKEVRVNLGLEKIVKGGKDVEAMKLVLAEEESKLKEAERASNEMLTSLEVSSLEAKRESDLVTGIRDHCERDAAVIAAEKAVAEEELYKAKPFLDDAERALNSIRATDIQELKKIPNPTDIIKLVFDCVCILKHHPLNRVEMAQINIGIGREREVSDFIRDSYDLAKVMIADIGFIKSIRHFGSYEKDNINEETIELLSPYLELEQFKPVVARNASRAAEGLCAWVRAMTFYHEASKVVKPKLEALKLAEARQEAAEQALSQAETNLKDCRDVLEKLQVCR